jgi:hypothetical protein
MIRLLAAACCALLAAPARVMKENLEIEDDSRAMIAVDTFFSVSTNWPQNWPQIGRKIGRKIGRNFYNGQITLKMKDFVVSPRAAAARKPPPFRHTESNEALVLEFIGILPESTELIVLKQGHVAVHEQPRGRPLHFTGIRGKRT